jgi:hypothetical protein
MTSEQGDSDDFFKENGFFNVKSVLVFFGVGATLKHSESTNQWKKV